MQRSSRAAAGAMGLMVALLTAALQAEEPAKKAEAVKPPWQRLLQGADAKEAAEQEKKLTELQEAGKFAEALKGAEELAELRQKVQGADHWEAINARWLVAALRCVIQQEKETRKEYAGTFALSREADELESKGRYKDAEPLKEKILAIRRKVLGEEHPDSGQGYHSVAYNQAMQGQNKKAEEGNRMALANYRKLLGEDHPETARSYHNLAASLNAQGKYKEAEEGFGKALAIRRKVLGERHPDTATSYNNVAYNHNAQGNFKEAERVHRMALAIRRKVLGEEHADTALSYGNLALNQHAQGRYQEAEENSRKALAIYRKVLGEEHPYTAMSYGSLARNLNAEGRYKEAEEGCRKALALRRKVLGEDHPDTALSYDYLAQNLISQGKYREAEQGFRKALAICRKVLGEEHPYTATSYADLAASLNAQGKYKEAEEDVRKALAIHRNVQGEEHRHTATCYNNLAASLFDQGKYKEAEEGFGKALAIRRKVLGEEHPDTATSYNNVAYNHNVQGNFKEAEEVHRKALALRRNLLGEEHPDTATSYTYVAFNLSAQGKYREAESFYLRAADAFAKARLHIAATGLERAAFTSERSPFLQLAAVLARNGKPEDAWQRFEASLARGTWDDLSARLRRPQAERDRQAQITARIDRLQKLIERVSVAKPTPEQGKQREELLSQLRQTFDELASFTQQLEKKYGPVAGQVFPCSQIQASLPADAALLAWLDIPGQPKAADPNGEHWAVLLRSAGPPIWVRLSGSSDKSAWTDADTQLPARLREALQSPGGVWQPLAERLRKQRLDPLAAHLKGVRRLIVLPSTALAGVPVEVMADGYTVSYAHSGTMYAHLLHPTAPSGEGMFALADPVFEPPTEKEKAQPLPPGGVLLTMVLPGSNAFRSGLKPNDVLLRYGDADLSKPTDFKLQPESNDPDKRVPVIVWRNGDKPSRPLFVRPGKLGVAIAQEPAPQAVVEQRRLDRLLVSRSGDDGKWDRLPGTRFEIASLYRLFDKDASVQMLLGSDASEQRLNELAQSGALSKYRYVHLATHGEVDNAFPLRSAVILSRDHLPDEKQRTELLLSGQPIPDGRLTAEQALQRWNLHCDLVTLSACQTALGKYERGEGFVGFAQALILCGTRSVCLSLWKVDDTATALLMERFYQNLLGKRDGLKTPMAKAEALAEAKAWLRSLPREKAIKRAAAVTEGVSRGKGAPKLPPLEVPSMAKAKADDRPFAHPYYWAAFVLVGHAD